MTKRVTSAGHDEERIGAFLLGGEADDDQSLDQQTVAEPSEERVEAAVTSAIDAPVDSANRESGDSDVAVSGGSTSFGSEIRHCEQLELGGDAGTDVAVTSLMSFVNRHLPVWRSVVSLKKQIDMQQVQIQAQQDHLNALAEQLRKREQLSGNSPCDQDRMDAWYQDLQDLHRGSQETLTEAQRSYVHHFNDCADHLKHVGPIFDLGCGRGEWLVLMAAEGWAVRGVDSSELAVHEARKRGLDVELGDLVEALEACPENALAGVTGFQIVEHLPFSRITALMHAAFRALVPGGLLLLETPNPENLQVATYGFWMDPTHRHPIPPPLIMDLSVHVGFRDGSILRRNPWPQWQETKVDSSLDSEFRYRFFGPQDYALLVYKPATLD